MHFCLTTYNKTSNLPLVKATLVAQDFINKGDLDKWLAYANALRLRMAVQVSLKGSLTSVGQAAVKECMARMLVTDDAKANNKANYEAVVAKQGDDGKTKLFWAK